MEIGTSIKFQLPQSEVASIHREREAFTKSSVHLAGGRPILHLPLLTETTGDLRGRPIISSGRPTVDRYDDDDGDIIFSMYKTRSRFLVKPLILCSQQC